MNIAAWVLAGITLALIAFGVFLVALVIWRLRAILNDFITPAGEGQPSNLAKIVDAGASLFARAVIAQAKTTLMGMSSGAVRAEKAVAGDLAIDSANQNAALSAILTSFPTLGKSLRRNPQLLDIALQFLMKRPAAPVPSNSNGGQQAKFRL